MAFKCVMYPGYRCTLPGEQYNQGSCVFSNQCTSLTNRVGKMKQRTKGIPVALRVCSHCPDLGVAEHISLLRADARVVIFAIVYC